MRFKLFLEATKPGLVVRMRMGQQVYDEFEYLMLELPNGSTEPERREFGDWLSNYVVHNVGRGGAVAIPINQENLAFIKELTDELAHYADGGWVPDVSFRTRPFKRMIKQLEKGVSLYQVGSQAPPQLAHRSPQPQSMVGLCRLAGRAGQ